MCGVIGYIGNKQCVELIFRGLKKLEYRGYDSAGIAVMHEGKVEGRKAKGKLTNLEPLLEALPQNANIGMGHTRWATHGEPSARNAHPHSTSEVAIVHNGIIENFQDIKDKLESQGVVFQSETDTEVILHLFENLRPKFEDVRTAFLATLEQLQGAFSVGLFCIDEPDAIHVAKQGSPMVLGVGDHEAFFASDALPLVPYTNEVVFLKDGQIAKLSGAQIDVWDFAGNPQEVKFDTVSWSEGGSDKGGFKHFMLKEIYQQPDVLESGIDRLTGTAKTAFNDSLLGLDALDLDKITRLHIVGCGTAYYAGLAGKYELERILKMPVAVELASEFRYRDPFLDESTLVIAMTQSGETADTLACVKHAKEKGCQVLSVCNVHFSSIPRESNATIYMECGPEIGVASTKAFTQMVLCLHVFTYAFAHRQGRVDSDEIAKLKESLNQLPQKVREAIAMDDQIATLSKSYFEVDSALFIGRASMYPIALEGALKLKEISYIHAEGYAGGELKHGPIALIDHNMPVIAICPSDGNYEKMVSNIEEIRARQARVIGVGQSTNSKLEKICENYIGVAGSDYPSQQAILMVVPMQLFSYHIATLRGTDVDQPRNLAKSVTVE